ncbi:MAG: hypothetical protein OEZ25_07205 [Candidatus Bathyarchaeota archaeon]|nr:hypothetical protein [Candidatus Bathyarchaeota archaeon]
MPKEGFKALGTTVREDVYNAFCAYARSKNTTPSTLLRDYVHEILAGQRKLRTPQELAHDIAVMSDTLRRSLSE